MATQNTRDLSNLNVKARAALAPGTHSFTEDQGVEVVLVGTAPNPSPKLIEAIEARGERFLRIVLVTVNVVAKGNMEAYKEAKKSGDLNAMLQCLVKRQMVITTENVDRMPSFQIGQAVQSLTLIPARNKDGEQVTGTRGALAGEDLFALSSLTAYQPEAIFFDEEEDEVEAVAQVDLD